MDDAHAFAPSSICVIGQPKSALDTPSLLVDLDVMEANTAKMAKTFRHNAINWRPHTKGMKIPALAHRLIKAGAMGVTCAKLGEAEVMAAGGVADILVANQIVGPIKIQRLVNLQRHADVMVAVDNWDNIREIDAAAIATGVRVRVLIEVNTGMNRAGTLPGQPTVALAKKVAALKGVKLAGLMTWEAHTLRLTDPAEKRKAIEGAISTFVGTAEACRAAGVAFHRLDRLRQRPQHPRPQQRLPRHPWPKHRRAPCARRRWRVAWRPKKASTSARFTAVVRTAV